MNSSGQLCNGHVTRDLMRLAELDNVGKWNSSDGRRRIPFAVLLQVALRMSEFGTKLLTAVGQSMSALPDISDVNLFRCRKGIIYLDAKVSDGAFYIGVTDPFQTCTNRSVDHLAGAPGITAATPSGLMLKAKNVRGVSLGFPH